MELVHGADVRRAVAGACASRASAVALRKKDRERESVWREASKEGRSEWRAMRAMRESGGSELARTSSRVVWRGMERA